jgi:anti-anti-sigma regulatory factor
VQVERGDDGRWVVRFTHNIDLAESGITDRLREVLSGDCRHLLLDLTRIESVSLLEADSLYVLRAAAIAAGATLEMTHVPPQLQRLLDVLGD